MVLSPCQPPIPDWLIWRPKSQGRCRPRAVNFSPHQNSNSCPRTVARWGGTAGSLLVHLDGGDGLVVVETKLLGALVDVVDAAKEHVHLLEGNLFGLGDQEVYKDGKDDVDGHEEEETLEAAVWYPMWKVSRWNGIDRRLRETRKKREKKDVRVLQKLGKELLKDGVGHVLHLRAHANGLGAHVHGKDLGGPDPGGGAPAGLVKERKHEEQEDDGDADGLRLAPAVNVRRGEPHDGHGEHAQAHADGADDEQPAAPEAVGRPGGVEREDDAKRRVERVDQVDGGDVGPHLFVDGRAVAVERALAGELEGGLLLV